MCSLFSACYLPAPLPSQINITLTVFYRNINCGGSASAQPWNMLCCVSITFHDTLQSGVEEYQISQVCLHFTLQWQRVCTASLSKSLSGAHRGRQWDTHLERDKHQHKDKHKSAKSPISLWLVKIFVYFQAVRGGRFISLWHLPVVSPPSSKSTLNGPGCFSAVGVKTVEIQLSTANIDSL